MKAEIKFAYHHSGEGEGASPTLGVSCRASEVEPIFDLAREVSKILQELGKGRAPFVSAEGAAKAPIGAKDGEAARHSPSVESPAGDSEKLVVEIQTRGISDDFTDQLIKNGFPPLSKTTVAGQDFYFSGQASWGGKNVLVMYAKNLEGKFRPRFIYRSKSDGTWRSTPGIEFRPGLEGPIPGRLIKGEEDASDYHYVQETLLNHELIQHLNNRPPLTAKNDGLFLAKQFLLTFAGNGIDPEVRKASLATYQLARNSDPKVQDLLNLLQECKPGDCFKVPSPRGFTEGPQSPLVVKKQSASEYIHSLNEKMKRLPLGFLPDFKLAPKYSYSTSHTLISKEISVPGTLISQFANDIQVEVFSSKLNGREIEWHMAKDKTGRVWIERLKFANSTPNSFENDELIDSGILTNKPFDYKIQLGLLRGHETKPCEVDSNYLDITPTSQKFAADSKLYSGSSMN